ncbi:MCE family protein [Gordonia sp. zg691]|uniref:MCE family protein n=1 Tax=Gordonia jinghuaiqii TaxID=2758710 RepID=A0A7D7LVD0_9ACTN|nr:MCE family protein [Gordonia jinghuaiqii]MBD0862506.1 MCE family protein [Gordonia jinghuaiqii]MCR5976607.1 MCE family protein [Gordonia jinghuaiqii]QMS99795.1 MCE family protein [Gordonia jinghuaiqii]
MLNKVVGSLKRPKLSNPVKGRLEDKSRFTLGVSAILILALVVLGIVGIGRLGVGDNTVDAEFAQAAQISGGDQVTAAGVPIGTVRDVRLAGDRVVVSMKIDGDVDLGADTKAAIKLTTLLGSRYVEIQPAGNGDIPDDVIPLANTTVPYDLQTALANATTTFEQVDAERIAESMTVLSEQLDGAPYVIPQALENIENLSSIIADRRTQIGQLLASTNELTTAIRNQQVALGQMVIRGEQLVTELVTRIGSLQRLIASTTRLIGNLHQIVGVQGPQVTTLLQNMETMLGAVSQREDVLRNTFQILPVPIRNFANATGYGNNLEFNAPAGSLVDSWMCAVSGQARMMSLAEYFKECK